MISIRNLSVIRDGLEVLQNIHADIRAGEIVAVIGPNGAGKSTLLKCLLGFLIYTGTITIFGKRPTHALDQIGYVPQRFTFDKNFPLTVAEFLRLSCDSQPAIKHALKEVEMDAYHDALLGRLSGGQLQRVLIARAIANSPKLLLLDEPTTGIDLGGEKDFYEIIAHQNQQHDVTIVMVSHEVNMVYTHATHVLCLNKSVCGMGRPNETLTRDVLELLYGRDTAIRDHEHHAHA